MQVTITLDKESAEWLAKNIKGGLSPKRRKLRASVVRQLEGVTVSQPTPRIVASSKGRPVGGKAGTVHPNTIAFASLEPFGLYEDGLTADEAAVLTSIEPLKSSTRAVSTLKQRGFLRVVGMKGRREVLALTTKGKKALRDGQKGAQ